MMGRRRQHRRDLPQRMYVDRGVYYFWPPGGRKIWFRRATGEPMPLHEAMAEYGKIVHRPATFRTVSDLIDDYNKLALPKLKARTQQDRQTELGNLRVVFGEMDPTTLTPQDIYGYKWARASAPVRCNRELAALSALLSFGVEQGWRSKRTRAEK
jgi:hypothetical protein